MLFVALHTGARAQEILNLTRADLDELQNSLYITGLKGSSDREIPLPKFLGRTLANHIKPLAPGERLFPLTYNRLRQIWVIYRPSEKKFHSLRHTFAIRTYLRTKDVRLLQIALGHRSILNTMIYVDFAYSQSALKALIEPGA